MIPIPNTIELPSEKARVRAEIQAALPPGFAAPQFAPAVCVRPDPEARAWVRLSGRLSKGLRAIQRAAKGAAREEVA